LRDRYINMENRTLLEIKDLVTEFTTDGNTQKWIPLYSMVTFSEMRYSEALTEGKRQDTKMDEVLALPNIANSWQQPEIFSRIEQIAGVV